MIIADDDKSLRARLWRVWWFVSYYVTYSPKKAYSRLLCATFGCRWYDVKLELYRDHATLSTWHIIGHTCQRCMRTTVVPVMMADEITGGPKDVA